MGKNRKQFLTIMMAVAIGVNGIPAFSVSAENVNVIQDENKGETPLIESILHQGWSLEDGNWYYYEAGSYLTSCWKMMNGIWYYFDHNGYMATGWKEINGKWYWFAKSGAMQTGWKAINGKWYWLAKSGAMQTGWQAINGKWYWFAKSGAMQTGWQKINDKWYWLAKSGAMQTGWQAINGKWYWLAKSGAMQTGWQKINGKWYWLAESGAMQTGWKQLSGVWYYMNSSGEMVTGKKTISGKRYYFNQGGALSELNISDVINNALKPVGKTLYVWGGGWNKSDNGSGETALHNGLWPQWEEYYEKNKNNYSYRPGKTAWENGKREYRFWGLDCSGYLGWVIFNSVENGKDHNGYVTLAKSIAESLADYGFGTVSTCTPNSTFYPGDIVSTNGHCFLCLGQCKDGSVLILHSTPNGGVQMSGTVNGGSSSQASILAKSFMQQYYPDWWKYFGKEGKQSVSAGTYLYGTKFSWQNNSVIYDSQSLKSKSADQVLDYIQMMK